MVEIIERKHPFSSLKMKNCSFREDQIREEVVRGGRPAIPSVCPPSLASLISSCWAHDPAERFLSFFFFSFQFPLVFFF